MPRNTDQPDTLKLSNEVLIPELIKYIDQGHTVTLVLNGYSMRPFLENGRDRGLLSRPTNPRVGDPVLAIVSDGRYVLHRIVDITPEGQVTLRGDGNLGCEHCTLADIKASVIGFYRKGSNKLDRTDGLKWRVYSYVWTRLLPVRRYLLFAYRVWHKLGSLLKGGK